MPQTTSFELSKQLFEVAKSKRVELPPSEYVSQIGIHGYTNLIEKSKIGDTFLIADSDCIYPSYTTDELLAWLPANIGNNNLDMQKWSTQLVPIETFAAVYSSPEFADAFCIEVNQSPSNALAKLAIYLIENDLLK
jgi:hypothetical protein